MKVVTFAAFHRKPKYYVDEVRINDVQLCVSYPDGNDVVVLSKSNYEGMEETFHLLESPANAARLLKSMEDYEHGLGQERKLINH